MIEKIVYVADDGKEFEDQDECLEYEAQIEFSDLLQSITFFSEDGEVINFENCLSEFGKAFDDAVFILIPSYLCDERIKDFSDTVYKSEGMPFPTTTGLYRWDYTDEKWVSFKTETQQFIKEWESILNITVIPERR